MIAGGEETVIDKVPFGLGLALVSAVTVNWAYTLEHAAASRLPRLNPRRPFRSLGLLLRNRPWLFGFALEGIGWLMYLAALLLAPLSLVQAVSASGIAVLALLSVHGHPGRLSRHEQLAVALALIGLALLSVSIVGVHPSSQVPHPAAAVVWLAAVAGAAVALVLVRISLTRAVALGLAAGLLFADGDVSAKLITLGGLWLLALVSLIAAYAAGTTVLQMAFQHGSALTSAGLATLVTNALPIAAGFVLFDEMLPHHVQGVLQIAAFATVVASAALLGNAAARPDTSSDQPTGAEPEHHAAGTGEAERAV